MKKHIILPPEGGWKQRTFYVVEIAINLNNPIHHDIFYTGFLYNGLPSGYNMLMDAELEISEVRYIKAIREINHKIDNEGRFIRDVVPEYFL